MVSKKKKRKPKKNSNEELKENNDFDSEIEEDSEKEVLTRNTLIDL